MMERWDGWLVAEHELIERAMDILKIGLQKARDGEHDTVQMGRALDFLREFGDKVHNKKEEDFLFPLMAQRGIPTHGGPIAVMLAEHRRERELLDAMMETLAEDPWIPTDQRAAFVSDGLAYLTTRAEHIWKENDVLYAMGRRVLTESDNQALIAQFAKLDQDLYGAGAHEQFRTMVEEVEAGGGGLRSLVHNLSYEQIDAILETLPIELTFIDERDTVTYFNRLDRDKIFVRTRSVVGRRVEKCHPEASVARVLEIVEGFKNRSLDKADFWIDFRDDKVLIRYFPVYDRNDAFRGVLEAVQSVGWIQELEGQKTLLHG
jgi:DUF438 domain-containing protein